MTRPTRRSRLLRLAAVAAVPLLGLPACSTVPTTSATVQITQAPVRPDPDVGIEPLSPEPGASPEEIVRGFIDAAASPLRGHPVAKEHLTPEAAASWADDTGITVIGSEYSTIATADGSVTVTAPIVGTIDQRGIFSVTDDLLTREYTLVEVGGEWRITDPPDGLTILEPDFQRLYDELAVYFLDPTRQRLVPDPRYLISGEAQPTQLVERLFDGPAPTLRAGVRNPLAGVELRRAVTVDGTSATVDLTGVPTEPEAEPVLAELSAQLVHTLEQSRIRSVLLLIDGERVRVDGVPSVQTVDDWAAYAPDAVPVDSVGHYVDGGALRTVPEGEPVPGPAGEGAYRLTSAIAAADPRDNGELSFLAGVTRPGPDDTVELLAGPYGGTLVDVLSGRSLTPPTVAATRTEVWTVRDGSEVVRVPSGGKPQQVVATTLDGLGRTEQLQLSPDGVRAAAVVDGGNGPSLYVGTVVRDTGDGAVALRDLQLVAPTLTQVVDVAWRDSGHLLVLAGDVSEDRVVPYAVGVDGWGLESLSTAGLPSQPTSIAAVPTKPPLASADRTIWQLDGGTWKTLVRGAEPQPGTEPFYPL